MRLLLFDIDGTLVTTGEAGLIAFAETLERVFGAADDLSRVDFAGATDTGIIAQLFGLHGIEHTAENIGRFQEGYFPSLARLLPEREGRVLPGVPELLAALAGRDDVQVALLTGNFATGARLKLEYYGLWQHFPFGAFADDHADRNKLGPVAVTRAVQHVGRPFAVERDVWIIGDTPKDVACARAFGARVLAVATGRHGEESLRQHSPDVLRADLSDVDQVADILTRG